jgi:hypothetical protein
MTELDSCFPAWPRDDLLKDARKNQDHTNHMNLRAKYVSTKTSHVKRIHLVMSMVLGYQ